MVFSLFANHIKTTLCFATGMEMGGEAFPSPKDLRAHTYICIFLGIKCLVKRQTKKGHSLIMHL